MNLYPPYPPTLDLPPAGELTTVTVTTPSGESDVTGHFYPYDHLDGGLLLFPQVSNITSVSTAVGTEIVV